MPAKLRHLMRELSVLTIEDVDDLSPRELWELGETLSILEEGEHRG